MKQEKSLSKRGELIIISHKMNNFVLINRVQRNFDACVMNRNQRKEICLSQKLRDGCSIYLNKRRGMRYCHCKMSKVASREIDAA